MDWTPIVVAVIAAFGGFLGSVLSNNKQVAVLAERIDALKEELERQGQRIDQHNHLNERLAKVEAKLEVRDE